MAIFNFNGSSIEFSRNSYAESGAAISSINNIYSYVLTENTSSRVSLWGYLYNGYRFDSSISLSSRSGNSFTANRLSLNLYNGYIPIGNFIIEGSVSFNGVGITGGVITKESYSINNDSGSYTGSYDVIRTSRMINNNSYGALHRYLSRGNDTFNGTNSSDTIESGSGNDLINAKSGADIVYGQNGNDKLNGGNGNDQLFGGSGNDIINGGFGNDSLVGGTGIDTAVFSNRANIIDLATTTNQNTGDGQDNLTGIENVNAGGGNDTIYGNSSSNKLIGDKGRDELYGDGGADKIYGGNGNDILSGGLGNDRLVGGEGKDTALFSVSDNTINLGTTRMQNTGDGRDILIGIENVNGGGGNDTIRGNNAANTLRGEDDADKLFGNNGADKLYGGTGNDLLNGGNGNDRLVGGDGVDTALFSSKNNLINLGSSSRQNTRDGQDILIGIENVNGGGGNDIIRGNSDENTFRGGSGVDKLYGMAGADTLLGQAGNDTLYGGGQDDLLYGGGGVDKLYGQDGDDTLFGGQGNDTLYGGAGSDIFQIDTGIRGVGRDLITDYDSGSDYIELLGGAVESDLTLNYVGGDTRIKVDNFLLAIVQNTIAEDITFI